MASISLEGLLWGLMLKQIKREHNVVGSKQCNIIQEKVSVFPRLGCICWQPCQLEVLFFAMFPSVKPVVLLECSTKRARFFASSRTVVLCDGFLWTQMFATDRQLWWRIVGIWTIRIVVERWLLVLTGRNLTCCVIWEICWEIPCQCRLEPVAQSLAMTCWCDKQWSLDQKQQASSSECALELSLLPLSFLLMNFGHTMVCSGWATRTSVTLPRKEQPSSWHRIWMASCAKGWVGHVWL